VVVYHYVKLHYIFFNHLT